MSYANGKVELQWCANSLYLISTCGSVWILQVLSIRTSTPMRFRNPTARQRVDRSSPLYLHEHSHAIPESHTAAACGSFKSSLPPRIRPEDRESHSAERVDRSGPFY